MGGTFNEVPRDNPILEVFESKKLSLYDLWELFDLASKDKDVSAIYLEIHPLGLTFSQIEELRSSIHKFRSSGKKIHAFLSLDIAGENEIYLASAADTLLINPGAGLILNGLVAEIQFYKKLLVKVGIKPEFIHFKEFQSPEQYTRINMSQSIRSMMKSILEDMQVRFIKAVSNDRKIKESVLHEVINIGIINASEAAELKLVDAVGYRHQVQDRLAKDTGRLQYKGMPARNYLESARSRKSSQGPRIALIGATGLITSGKSDYFGQTLGGSSMAEILLEIRKSKKYDAVLLRINSPGGSAVGSDMIWQEVQLLEKSDIPVIVSMSGVAGSGGYYIAMAASKIISHASTITGSIGVIFGKFDLSGLYELVGINTDRVKISPNADLLSSSTSLSPKQREAITSWVQTIYNRFVSKAASGREMDFGQLEAKARGRIYTGEQARAIGLVDDIGGFEKAVEHIRAELNLKKDSPIQLILLPKSKGFWETFTDLGSILTFHSNPLKAWFTAALKELQTPRPRLLLPSIQIN